jgi:hypothetical protein
MKKRILIVIIGMLSLGMSMNSCTAEDKADTRDQYVGTWNLVAVGSVNTIENGSIVDTEIVNETESVNISKSGENDLLIDGRIYFVNNFTLTSTPATMTNNDGDFTSSVTLSTTGVISLNSCTLVNDVTGTWTSGDRNGTYSGVVTETLTK